MMSLHLVYKNPNLNTSVKFQLVNTEFFHIAMQQFQILSLNNYIYHIPQVHSVW